MPLLLKQKKAIVAQVADEALRSLCVVAADYRGLSSVDLTILRAKARDMNVVIKVVRNTLARLAFKDTECSSLNDSLTGPVLLAFAINEPGAAARLLRDFAKTNDKLQVKALCLNGKLYDNRQLEAIASLPTKEEAIVRLLLVLKAPIAKYVRTLAEPTAKMVRTLAAVRDAKQTN